MQAVDVAELGASERRPADRAESPARCLPILLAWLAAGVLLVATLNVQPVLRTQEGRVLESAREMAAPDAPARQWLVPQMNGRVRLQKPPLAYWVCAATFKVLGVSQWAGRLPMALASWLTVGATYLAASRLFNRRAAFFAAAALLGSFLFFRIGRLAETDVLVTLFVTFASYALWRGFWICVGGEASPALWFHGAALAMALAALSKGPPAAYPLLFFVALCGFERRWKPLLKWVICGAPLTFAAVAVPWFAYVATVPEFSQTMHDLRNSAGGGKGHSALFITYFPQLLQAAAPWSGVVVIAVFTAFRRWKSEPPVRAVLLWSMAVFVPLCAWGNKQIHYLLPMMPPVMMLVGWAVDRALRDEAVAGERKSPAVVVVVAITLAICALGAPAVLWVARHERGRLAIPDIALAAAILTGVAAAAYVWRARGTEAGMQAFAVLSALLLASVLGWWGPSLEPDPRRITAELRSRFGVGPYAFRMDESVALVFTMRSTVPVYRTDEAVMERLARDPGLVVMGPLKEGGRKLDPPPAVLKERMSFPLGDERWRVYRADAPAASASQTAVGQGGAGH